MVSPLGCMRGKDWQREMVLVALYQMESDGIVRVVQTPRGESFELASTQCAMEPMVRRRFEVVA